MTVAVLVTRVEEARALVHWGALFARARGVDVVVFVPTPSPGTLVVRVLPVDPEAAPDDEARSVVEAAHRAQTLVPTLPVPDGEERPPPAIEVVCLGGPRLADVVLEQMRERESNLLVLPRHDGDERKGALDAVARRLFERSPCPTLVLRPGGDEIEDAGRVLVPTSGGPHAALALELACELAGAAGGRVAALYVQTEMGEDAQAVGDRVLDRAIAKMSAENRERIDGKVVLAEGVLAGIAAEAKPYDLLLIGTSDHWVIRRILFRTLPEAVLAGPEGTSVAVVRRGIPWRSRLQDGVARLFKTTVPQMGRPDRIALMDRLQSGARWSFDFVLLTCLATLIASLGLIAGNVAVVIGAMLVAPLMTPLIAAGLALVQGNFVLLRRALRTTLGGFLVAFGLAVLVGVLLRPEVSLEMASRGRPGAIDLAVAFVSGLAAAYAIGRPGLTAALPGVAIAAALVPPVATAGLALPIGRPWLAAGAGLLLFTNLVAIALGAAVTLVSVGVRASHLHRRQRVWVRRLVIAVFVLAALAVIPLGFLLARIVSG